MADDLCAKTLLLSAEDPKADIYMYINSPGGSVAAGLSIYDIPDSGYSLLCSKQNVRETVAP